MTDPTWKVVDVGVRCGMFEQCHLASESFLAIGTIVLIDSIVRVHVGFVACLCAECLVTCWTFEAVCSSRLRW